MAKTSTPKPEKAAYPHPFSLIRPIKPAAALAFGEQFAAGKTPDPTKGMISLDEYVQLFNEFDENAKLREKAYRSGDAAAIAKLPLPPTMPFRYQPTIMDALVSTGAMVAMGGQRSKHKNRPSKWIESRFGKWIQGMYLESGVARRCHKEDVRDLVVDRETNVVKVHKSEYVIGTPETSAVFLLNASKTGNYGANILAAKKLAFGNTKGLGNLVAQINNDFVLERVNDGTTPGGEIAWGPNQFVKWGRLVRDGSALTYNQIRKAIADGELTGISFESLEAPIVGESFNPSKLWTAVKNQMSLAGTKNADDETALDRFEGRKGRSKDKIETAAKAWRNFMVQCRVTPDEIFPFGFFSAQTGVVPCSHFGDKITDELVTMVIGTRLGTEWSESRKAARRRLGLHKVVAAKKVTKTVKTPKAPKSTPKPKKAAKPKSAAKTPKKTPTKKPATAVASEPAAPVTDTSTTAPVADTPVTVN